MVLAAVFASWFEGAVLDVVTLDPTVGAVKEGGVDIAGNMDRLAREGDHLSSRWENWSRKIHQNVRCLWNVLVNKGDRWDVRLDDVSI